MKIGFDYRMSGPGHGGIGRYGSELLHHLLSLNTNDRFVVTYNDSIDQSDLNKLGRYSNVELVKVKSRHYSLLEQTEFLGILTKLKLDLIHFPNFNHPIKYQGKFVTTIHDMIHHELSGHKPFKLLHFWAYKKVMEHAVSASCGIITPSGAAREMILKYYPNVKDKISVIYEGASLPMQNEEFVKKIKRQFLLRRPYFLFVGTFERKKMVPLLARAFDLFIEKYKMDMDLVLVGKTDPYYPEERVKVLEIKHHHRLILSGFVSDEELSALYQGAYAYISLSPNEGFNLPGIEALSCGLPVITVNVLVANEIFDSGALYCEPGNPEDAADKMHLLARDSQFYQRQAAASLKRGQAFSWQRAAEETMEVYRQTLR